MSHGTYATAQDDSWPHGHSAEDDDDDQLPADTGDNLQAISCGDSIDAGNATIQNTFDEILFVTRNVSPLFGPSFSSQGCVFPPLV